MDNDVREKLEELNTKIDRLLEAVKELQDRGKARTEPKKTPAKSPISTSPKAIEDSEKLFSALFERWLAGEHLEVRAELEKMDADTIRHFADANNLNVTAKTPMAKTMELISARFREKKQLLAGMRSFTKQDPTKRDAAAEISDTAVKKHVASEGGGMGYVFHFDADRSDDGSNYAYSSWTALFREIATYPLKETTLLLTGDIVKPGVAKAMQEWLSPPDLNAGGGVGASRDALYGMRNVFVTAVMGGDSSWAAAVDQALHAVPAYLGCRPVVSNTPLTKAALATLSKRFWILGKQAAIYGMDDEDHHDPELESLLTRSGFRFDGYSTKSPWPCASPP